MDNQSNTMIVQNTYPIPANISPSYFVGAFGSICTSLGVIHHMPDKSNLGDLPSMLVGDSIADVNRMVNELLVDIQLWSAEYTSIACEGSIIGNNLYLHFTLSGKKAPYVNLT